jgi:hypothetical protein
MEIKLVERIGVNIVARRCELEERGGAGFLMGKRNRGSWKYEKHVGVELELIEIEVKTEEY